MHIHTYIHTHIYHKDKELFLFLLFVSPVFWKCLISKGAQQMWVGLKYGEPTPPSVGLLLEEEPD